MDKSSKFKIINKTEILIYWDPMLPGLTYYFTANLIISFFIYLYKICLNYNPIMKNRNIEMKNRNIGKNEFIISSLILENYISWIQAKMYIKVILIWKNNNSIAAALSDIKDNVPAICEWQLVMDIGNHINKICNASQVFRGTINVHIIESLTLVYVMIPSEY